MVINVDIDDIIVTLRDINLQLAIFLFSYFCIKSFVKHRNNHSFFALIFFIPVIIQLP